MHLHAAEMEPRKRQLDSKKAEEISFRCPVPAYAEKEHKGPKERYTTHVRCQ